MERYNWLKTGDGGMEDENDEMRSDKTRLSGEVRLFFGADCCHGNVYSNFFSGPFEFCHS